LQVNKCGKFFMADRVWHTTSVAIAVCWATREVKVLGKAGERFPGFGVTAWGAG